jgi:hypothetical protein
MDVKRHAAAQRRDDPAASLRRGAAQGKRFE